MGKHKNKCECSKRKPEKVETKKNEQLVLRLIKAIPFAEPDITEDVGNVTIPIDEYKRGIDSTTRLDVIARIVERGEGPSVGKQLLAAILGISIDK